MEIGQAEKRKGCFIQKLLPLVFFFCLFAFFLLSRNVLCFILRKWFFCGENTAMGLLDETGLARLGEDEVKRESFTSYNEKKSLLKKIRKFRIL